MQNEGKCAAAGLRQEWILIMDEARTGALKRAVAIREKAAGAGPDALLREVMEAAKAEGFAGCYPLCAVRESVGLLQGCFLFLIPAWSEGQQWQIAEELVTDAELAQAAARYAQVQLLRNGIYAALAERLVAWFHQNARLLPWRQDRDPDRIWLSEIMLQQTRAGAAIPYYERFLEKIPTITHLAQAKEAMVMKLWEGLGYYSRARNLQKAAQQIVREYGGEFPREVEKIRALPGIGPYTAGAIAAICFDEPEPAIDGNVLRVLSRVMGDFRPIEMSALRRDMEAGLRGAYPAQDRGSFEQSLIELGAIVCVPNAAPACAACPLAELCLAHAWGVERELPVRMPKKARRIEQRGVLLLWCHGKVALRRRAPQGLLAGLWELPNFEGDFSPQQLLELAERLGAAPVRLEQILRRRHIFSHVEWDMQGAVIACAEEAEGFFWADADALRDEVALPSAFKIFFDKI